jgi:hypothetical protein
VSSFDPPAPTAEDIHHMEQQWAIANAKLDEFLAVLRHDIPVVKKVSGLTDDSIAFSYMWGFIKKSHAEGGSSAVKMTEVMCAAAFTRLVRATRAEDDMSQFEWKDTTQ